MFKVGDRVEIDWMGDGTKMCPGTVRNVEYRTNRFDPPYTMYDVNFDVVVVSSTGTMHNSCSAHEKHVRLVVVFDSFNQQVADYCQRELGRV